jgi:tetratricopeptide (TPR) repeat protein
MSHVGKDTRSALVAAISARLKQIVATQDLSFASEPGALDDARQLRELLQEDFDVDDVDARYVLGWWHWYRCMSLKDEGLDNFTEAVQILTPCFLMDMQPLPEPLLSPLASSSKAVAVSLTEEAFGSSDLNVISSAVRLWQRIVAATADNHRDRASRLSNLSAVLKVRFGRTGDLADLNAAVKAARQAVDATAHDHPELESYLCNLCVGLWTRFERTGDLGDLDMAVEAARQAVAASLDDHLKRARNLANLGAALSLRFGRVGDLVDLNAAVEAMRQAADTLPRNNPDRAVCFANLAVVLKVRFGRNEDLADLNAAVKAAQQAVDATAENHPNRAGYLCNLGDIIGAQFKRTGNLEDLEEAIKMGWQGVNATPDNHPELARRLYYLGLNLRTRFGRTGEVVHVTEALAVFATAVEATAAEPSVRIHAAQAVAFLATALQVRRSEAIYPAELLETAVRLLPETAQLQLDRSDQQHVLGGFAGLASDAAALVLASTDTPGPGKAARALGLLELGRAVLLSHSLNTRSDLTNLRDQHPDLAARFIRLRDELDPPSTADTPFSDLAVDADIGSERRNRGTGDRHQLAAEFAATVDEIRELDGFLTFLCPPEPEELIADAAQGPVVVFNVSRLRSDALLVATDGITALPLPNLDYHVLTEKISSFQQALRDAQDPVLSPEKRDDADATLNEILEWLWDSATGPVLHSLGFRNTVKTQLDAKVTWPRIWWAPGGLLAQLPLHAAGHHRDSAKDGRRDTVIDRVVSSYTPTVRALRYARRHIAALPAPANALIVAMPTTPGHNPLPQVHAEVTMLQGRLPRHDLLINKLSPQEDPNVVYESAPTKANVLARLADCSIAHFACHGTSDPTDPSRSRLLLYHTMDPLTVASLAPVRLEQAKLAYLSACRTAFNNVDGLIDEAIHLATAFQLAGFRHVVGTLWEIGDRLAVYIADAFYTALQTESGDIDTSRAAYALHHAMRSAREMLPAPLSRWAAYIHAGA